MSTVSNMRGIGEIVAELQRRVLAVMVEDLIPDGTIYGAGSVAPVAVRQGDTYVYTSGANEVSCDNSGTLVANGQRFIATGQTVILNGSAGNVPVTGQISEAAFGRVELFDSEDLTAAFQFLLITEQRVCVIVPLDAKFEQVFQVRKLTSKRNAPIALLCSDRVLGDRKAALWGRSEPDGVTEHGAMFLAELTLPACAGLLLPNPKGVVCEPQDYSVLTIRDTDQDQQSRVCVAVDLECKGGYLEADLGRSPVL
jgi:hypothetical protein